jgi:hypothetical protein
MAQQFVRSEKHMLEEGRLELTLVKPTTRCEHPQACGVHVEVIAKVLEVWNILQ